MTAVWLSALFVVLGWILINLKTSRPDATLVAHVPDYRAIVSYIMPTSAESVVYFDIPVRAERLIQYVEAAKERLSANLTHCLVAAAVVTLAENPPMRRFVVGRRLYQRTRIHVTFSAKRRKLDKESAVSAIKLEALPGESFATLVQRVNDRIEQERSETKTYSDKELRLFLKLPRAVLVRAVRLMHWLDYHNLLPARFIDADPLYTGMFITNLGSIGMGPGFFHLYEWGHCPHVLMVGAIEERVVVEQSKIAVVKVLPIRATYDDRIEDALTARHGIETLRNVLEDPFRYLGCLEASGADARALFSQAPAPPSPQAPAPPAPQAPAPPAPQAPAPPAPQAPPARAPSAPSAPSAPPAR